MELIVGKILCDRYRIVQKLDRDDLSKVYLAEDRSHNGKVERIIERFQPQYDREILGEQSWQKVRQTFTVQGNILKNLSQHPQIPQLFDFFECNREFYLVYEYIPGESLSQQLDRALIEEAEAIIWLQEITEILEYTHKLGIAHGNIQPSSLIRHQNGKRFLSDFSAIKNIILFGDRASKTVINPQFFPPQPDKSDFELDIYALGKTIIYALTGDFAGSIEPESSDNINSQKTGIPDSSSKAKIRPELADILNKMVCGNFDMCYQSASEILSELDFERNVVTFPPPFFDDSNFSQPSSSRKITSTEKLVSNAKFMPKIIWSLLALPFIIASVIIFIGINKNTYKNFVSYINSEYQFAIKYPRSWSQRQLDDPITGEIVLFASPLETDRDLFLEKVSITVEYLSAEPINLEQYTQTVVDRIRQTQGSNTEIYEDFETSIARFPTRTVIYSRQKGKLQLKQMEIFTIKNERVYIAIYTAEEAKFSKYYDTVKKMIDSWEIR